MRSAFEKAGFRSRSVTRFEAVKHQIGMVRIRKIFLREFIRMQLLRLLFVAIGIGLSAASLRAASLEVGGSFPDLGAFQLEGSMPETKGKVVLIDFFASWCAPCKASFPVMDELQKKFGSRGLVIVAISVDKKKVEFEQFLRKYPASFVVLRDPTGKVASEVKIQTMPSSFLIDRNGIVRARHDGFEGEKTREKYVSEIGSLLN